MRLKRILKPCAKSRHLPARQVRRDVGVVGALLLGVGYEHHDHVGLFTGLGDGDDAKARLFGLQDRRRLQSQADAHVVAAVVKVEGVGVALGAVAENGDLLRLQ